MRTGPAVSPWHGLLLMIAASVLGGTVGPAARVIRDHLPVSVLDLVVYRTGVGVLAMLLLLRALPRFASAGDWVVAGLIGIALLCAQFCYLAGLQTAGVTIATVVTFGVTPIFVAVGETVILRTTPSRRVISAMLTSILGLALLMGGGKPTVGAGLAALAGLLYATAMLASRARARQVDPWHLNLAASLVAAIVLVPVVAVNGLTIPDGPAELTGVLYFGIAGTLAFGLMIVALRGVTATQSAIVILLEPLTAGIIGVAFFAERLGAMAIFGGVLLLGSVIGLFRGNSQPPPSGVVTRNVPVSSRSSR